MQNLKVWEGLAALDRAQEQVRAGTYEQPIYSCAQVMEQVQEASSTDKELLVPIYTKIIKISPDYDELSRKLKGMVF